MKVKITSGEAPSSGIEIGDVFEANPYWLDPEEKVTLIRKISGSDSVYDESTRNHYLTSCEIINPKP